MALILVTGKINKNNPVETTEALFSEMLENDLDNNGENGDFAMWQDTKKCNLETNLDWLIQVTKKIEDPKERVEKFIKTLSSHDMAYSEYMLSFEEDATNIFVAFSYNNIFN